MNTNFFTPSLTQIQEKMSEIKNESLAILEWDQIDLWKDRIGNLKMKEIIPPYLVIPNTKDILSQFIRICDQNCWRIFPMGNGSKLDWGKLPDRATVLVSTSKLNQIIDHAVEDLTVTVQSGMKIKDLNDILALKGQFLPIDPCFPDTATIGGIIATANTGSWRHRYGGVRDLLLGVSFLRGDGKEAKAGGRVVKNVAGYDLMKLLTGSYGNLGIITEATFRLFPIPEKSITLLATGNKDGIYQLQKTILNSGLTPTKADLLSSSLVENCDLGKNLGLILRFQGISESIKQQSLDIKKWCEQLNLIIQEYEDDREITLWKNLRDKSYQGIVVCKVGIVPNKIIELIDNLTGNGIINISNGVGFITFSESIKSHQIINLRQFCEKNHGFLTVLNAPFKNQIEPWGYVGNGLKMMKIIKKNFDPQGRFVDRL